MQVNRKYNRKETYQTSERPQNDTAEKVKSEHVS